jgi:predicted anti-sigma-YlaC factor YlaD
MSHDRAKRAPLTGCREIERIIWTEGPEAAPKLHLVDCKSCEAESRRAADLRAALSGMQNRFAIAPPSLEAELIAAATRTRLERARQITSHPKFWRGAAVGAAAAAAAATAAVGIIFARRRATAADLVA